VDVLLHLVLEYLMKFLKLQIRLMFSDL